MDNLSLDHHSQIEAVWAERLVYADAMNAERRANFEARKAAIMEGDLPKSIINCGAPVFAIPVFSVSLIRKVSLR